MEMRKKMTSVSTTDSRGDNKQFPESKTRTYHGQIEAGRRRAEQRGGPGRGRTRSNGTTRPEDQWSSCPQDIEGNSPRLLFRNKSEGIPM